MKPVFRRGRFYNHENESVISWMSNVATTLSYYWMRILTGRRSAFFKTPFVSTEWVSQELYPGTQQGVTVTWLGHATFLIQIAGVNILTDPVFYHVSRFYPRMVPFPINLDKLPKIDVILLSHNHMDHMDERSLKDLVTHQSKVLVPFGDAARLKKIGFFDVHECHWKDVVTIGAVDKITLTFLPAVHWSGRGVHDVNRSLWGSWLIQGGGKSVYFGGDTAYGTHFSWIKGKYPSVDIALLPIGPIEPAHLMKHSHIGAVEALKAFDDLGARILIPMHWGTFRPASDDSFDTPINALQSHWNAEQQEEDKKLIIPRFGKKMEFS